MTLGKLLNLSVPQLSYKIGMLHVRLLNEKSIHIKGLEQKCLAHGRCYIMLAIIVIIPILQMAKLRLREEE